MKKRVLFVCTGNSARSQIAEGILRSMAGDRYEVRSAGTEPKGMHPMTIEVMKEIGIDVGGQTSKDVAQFYGESFDYVITVCDRARQHCPIFPGIVPLHWGFDDPAAAGPSTRLETFRRVRDEIRERIRQFVLSNDVVVAQAFTSAEYDQARQLFERYESEAGAGICFQGFVQELADIQRLYSSPSSALFLASQSGVAVGCVGIQVRDSRTLEMKRLFVDASVRGMGLGRRLADAALAYAHSAGYSTIVLSTLPAMTAAQTLYRSLGFVEGAPDHVEPVPGIIYMKLARSR